MRCITFKEYSMHLYSSKHIIAMRKQSLQLKQTLARMRMTQRQKQRIVEENESAQGSLSSRTRFCPICKLNYRQFKTKHQISDYHRAMKKFLMPYCRICRIGFKSPMLFENHICSLEHIKREARMKESMRFRERSRDDGSGIEDEDKEVNLDNFMTLDSVGTVDDDGDEEGSEGEGKGKSDKDKKESEEKKRTETNLGSEYIKKVEVLFCEMCRSYLPRLDQPERALSIHCRSRPHLTRYVRYRDDRSLRREAERVHQRKETKENADGEKSDKKKEAVTEKTIDSTTEKDVDVEMKDTEDGEDGDADASQEVAGEEGGGGQAGGDAAEGGEELDQELEAGMDDKLWDDVDKDLGDLLREVEPGNKSSDEDEDSRAEGGRYDRFRYSEKGSTGPHAEGDAPDTTKAAVDGEGERKSEAAEEAPAKEIKVETKDEADPQPKKQSPSGGAVSSAPVTVTTN
nr:hypothetical protein [Gryllus pennsylvanicus]